MESYFELLTEQQGLPASPFDPVRELKRLRRRLALRIEHPETPGETHLPLFQEEIEISHASPQFVSPKNDECLPEPVSTEAILKKVGGMKKTLAIWQRSRLRVRQPRNDLFRGHRKLWNQKRVSSVIAHYLDTSQESTLERVNAGLLALGVIGIVFGVLSFLRGWESDLSLGSLVCVSGAAIVAIGFGGRFLASQTFTESFT